MSARKPLTDEERRILLAALRAKLRWNAAGRWVIDGEARPDRKSRERMVKRGYVRRDSNDADLLRITPLGAEALRERRDVAA